MLISGSLNYYLNFNYLNFNNLNFHNLLYQNLKIKYSIFFNGVFDNIFF